MLHEAEALLQGQNAMSKTMIYDIILQRNTATKPQQSEKRLTIFQGYMSYYVFQRTIQNEN